MLIHRMHCTLYIHMYVCLQMWWLRTEDDMFTIRLALIVEEQSFAPHDPIFRVSYILLSIVLTAQYLHYY